MNDLPIFDPKAIERLKEWGGEELPKKMIEIVLRDTPSRMGRIEKGLDDGDPANVEAGAHSLKSSAGNVGALRLQALLQVVESAAVEKDLPGLLQRLPELKETFERTLEALENFKEGST